jgi:hypothetical protein
MIFALFDEIDGCGGRANVLVRAVETGSSLGHQRRYRMKSAMMVDRMIEIVWSEAASGRSPTATWHIRYVTFASTTCLSRTKVADQALNGRKCDRRVREAEMAATIRESIAETPKKESSSGTAPRRYIARSCGFGDGEWTRITFQRYLAIAPRDYRAPVLNPLDNGHGEYVEGGLRRS